MGQETIELLKALAAGEGVTLVPTEQQPVVSSIEMAEQTQETEQVPVQPDERQRMYVSNFEDQIVTVMRGKFPSLTLPMDEGYTRGTHLRVELDLRVKSVRHEELADGNLARDHVFAIEAVAIRSSYRPEDVADVVEGSASAAPTQTPEQAEELGMAFGRTSELWGEQA